jgi:hypothetical protein
VPFLSRFRPFRATLADPHPGLYRAVGVICGLGHVFLPEQTRQQVAGRQICGRRHPARIDRYIWRSKRSMQAATRTTPHFSPSTPPSFVMRFRRQTPPSSLKRADRPLRHLADVRKRQSGARAARMAGRGAPEAPEAMTTRRGRGALTRVPARVIPLHQVWLDPAAGVQQARDQGQQR